MAFHTVTNTADVCRVCAQDLTNVPSENLYDLPSPDCPSTHSKLIAICSQVFVEKREENLLADDVLALPRNVCLDCKPRIDDAYELHQMCLASHRMFLEMLTPTELDIKEELEDAIELDPSQVPLPEIFAECLSDLTNKRREVGENEPNENKTEELEYRLEPPQIHIPELAAEKHKGQSTKVLNVGSNQKKVQKKAQKLNNSRSKKQENANKVEPRPKQSSKILPESHEDQLIKALNVENKKMNRPRIYRCEKCKASASRPSTIFKHMRLKHPDEALPCSYKKCVEVYFDKDKLEEHKKKHTLKKSHPCPNCEKRFRIPHAVKVHLNKCTGKTPFLCTECGKAFPYASSLSQHLIRHKEKLIFCKLCPSKFHANVALRIHMLTHTKERKYHCEICGSGFQRKHALKQHYICHADVRPFSCDVCDLKFRTSYHLRRHLLTHSGEKPFKCTHCDRSFSQPTNLVKHSKIHFDGKPYKCEQCDETFRLLTDLRNHYKVHYQAGEKDKLDKPKQIEFTILSTLKRRAEQEKNADGQSVNREQNEVQKTPVDERPFHCDLCDMKFKTIYHLRRHLLTHTGEKPFKCTHCDRAFSQSGDLLKHSKTHFGENPYKCEHCDEAFRLLTDLRKHYKVHYQAGEKDKLDKPKKKDFTILSILKRRAEQEKNADGQPVNQAPNERNEAEMVQTTLAELSDFPIEFIQ